jgi:hypothetical protein
MSLCSDLGTSFLFHLMSLLTFTSIQCMLFHDLDWITHEFLFQTVPQYSTAIQ